MIDLISSNSGFVRAIGTLLLWAILVRFRNRQQHVFLKPTYG
jgi:hypothetical protein